MKTTLTFLLLLSLAFLHLPAQNDQTQNDPTQPKPKGKSIVYYRVDKVITIRGKVTKITSEKSYHKKEFTVIYLEDKKSGKTFRVDVSPQWFFKMDIMTGSFVEVTGSYSRTGGVHMMLTRSITYGGEHYEFRDKMGFPLWRGRRKGGDQPGKGRQRQRGRH